MNTHQSMLMLVVAAKNNPALTAVNMAILLMRYTPSYQFHVMRNG